MDYIEINVESKHFFNEFGYNLLLERNLQFRSNYFLFHLNKIGLTGQNCVNCYFLLAFVFKWRGKNR